MPTNKILTYAGIGSASLLASLPVFLTLSPTFASPEDASAVETLNATANSGAAVAVSPSISLSAQNVSVSASPSVGNTLVTAKAKVNVKNTGSSGGYHLTMASNNGGALKNGDKSINTFTDYKKTGAEMKEAGSSSWGYTLQDVVGTNSAPATDNEEDLSRTYYPIPTSSTSWDMLSDGTSSYAYLANTIGYTNKTAGDDIAVAYAFAIGPDASAGIYNDTITYTAIPNEPFAGKTIFDLTNMQDLATETNACKNTPTPSVAATEDTTTFSKTEVAIGGGISKIPTVTLKDTRDNNTYKVKKLADGNCWMTEDLKLNGDEDITLTSADSDTTSDITLQSVSLPGANSSSVELASYPASYSAGYLTYLDRYYTITYNGYAAPYVCPKGWQLPADIGNASWYKLFQEGQGIYEIAGDQDAFSESSLVTWNNYTNLANTANNPLGLASVEYYSRSSTRNDYSGQYWSSAADKNTLSRLFFKNISEYVYVNGTHGSKSTYSIKTNELVDNKKTINAVRCVSSGN